MAYGDIHNKTGTICKAKSDKTCPLSTDGGHSKDTAEYIETVSEREGLDAERVRSLVEDGTPAREAISIVREGLDAQDAQSKFSFRKPARTEAIGNYEMTDEKFDIHRVYPGERYYDSEGQAYIVFENVRGSYAKLLRLNSDGSEPRLKGGPSEDALLTTDPKTSNFLRRLDRPKDPRYSDGVSGQSESSAVKELPREGSWDRSISAVLNYRDENGDQKAIEFVAPVGRLTDKKRIEIGRQLFAFSGQDPQRYEDVADAEKLRWINQRVMRQENYSWKTDDDGTVSYSHSRGGGSSHSRKDIKLLDL